LCGFIIYKWRIPKQFSVAIFVLKASHQVPSVSLVCVKMSSRNSTISSESRYESAAESFTDAVDVDEQQIAESENAENNQSAHTLDEGEDTDVPAENSSNHTQTEHDVTENKDATIGEEPDYDDTEVEKFEAAALHNQNEYEEELSLELQRQATNLSKISRILTGKSEDLEKQPNTLEDEEDPEIVGYDPKTCDWDSPDDPANPYNWPHWKRWFCTMTTAILCLVITIGSSLYVDAVPEMMLKWKISQTLGLSGLTFYLLGLAFGPAFAAPLSELFGRKIVYCISLPVSMLFIMGVGLSKHIREVLVLRFFAGLTSSGALAIAGGTITDIWRMEEIGIAMSLFCLAPLAGPVIGPVIGGFVAQNKFSPDPNVVGGLRWVMWVNLFFAAVVFIPLFVMPETYKPIIMRKRLLKRGKTIRKTMSTTQFLTAILFITLLKPIEMIFVEPIVLVFSIYAAFVFAVLFGFFEAFPVIFRGVYGWEIGVSGLPFLGVGLGLLIGVFVYVLMDKLIFFKRWDDGYIGMKDKEGNPIPPTPESRLLPCMVGSVTFGPSLFWLAWTARESVNFMAPTAAGEPVELPLYTTEQTPENKLLGLNVKAWPVFTRVLLNAKDLYSNMCIETNDLSSAISNLTSNSVIIQRCFDHPSRLILTLAKLGMLLQLSYETIDTQFPQKNQIDIVNEDDNSNSQIDISSPELKQFLLNSTVSESKRIFMKVLKLCETLKLQESLVKKDHLGKEVYEWEMMFKPAIEKSELISHLSLGIIFFKAGSADESLACFKKARVIAGRLKDLEYLDDINKWLDVVAKNK